VIIKIITFALLSTTSLYVFSNEVCEQNSSSNLIKLLNQIEEKFKTPNAETCQYNGEDGKKCYLKMYWGMSFPEYENLILSVKVKQYTPVALFCKEFQEGLQQQGLQFVLNNTTNVLESRNSQGITGTLVKKNRIWNFKFKDRIIPFQNCSKQPDLTGWAVDQSRNFQDTILQGADELNGIKNLIDFFIYHDYSAKEGEKSNP
jgi:hypothetical protein